MASTRRSWGVWTGLCCVWGTKAWLGRHVLRGHASNPFEKASLVPQDPTPIQVSLSLSLSLSLFTMIGTFFFFLVDSIICNSFINYFQELIFKSKTIYISLTIIGTSFIFSWLNNLYFFLLIIFKNLFLTKWQIGMRHCPLIKTLYQLLWSN